MRTLATWRGKGEGPSYFKIGGKVMYSAHALASWEERGQMFLPAR